MALDKYFEPQDHEAEIYRRWEESGAFRAEVHREGDEVERPAFTISLPPPNATGTLHTGHAVMIALEDLMIRWRRMAGDEALWLPGTDHAAIATESVVIRQLQDEGMADPRGELGREELVRRIAEFVAGSRHRIREQMRALGASCDWSRERYTMDPQLNRCVNAVFARMFRDGLIYRGPRIVNWDPHLQTTVSDDEIYHQDRPGKFYTLRYGPFLVSTSRPETKLGDTAVAVHPDDARYQEFIGKDFEVEWPKGPTLKIRVVADDSVDMETGTGVLGVTPAHSHVDFDIAQRHDLPLVQVIGEDGCMTEAVGEHYAGMTVEACRTAFVEALDEAGLLEKVEDYTQSMSLCYRSKKPIEPLPKDQWFIDVEKPAVPWKGQQISLKQVLRDVVQSGDIQLLPEYQEKTYFHWIDNLRDWCISRQIWWGHRVPVWYRGSEDMYVGNRAPEGDGWIQDEDTLDTWFSSALWTWSTLVDPELAADPQLDLRQLLEQSPDFQRFHPTSVMETGYDILFFWVARMILMTTYATGEIPFRTVYLHGLILDKDGDKMSKSKPETCVDPLDTVEEYGADIMRLSLLIGNAPGKDLKLGKERLVGGKRLLNKIWNASKLIQMSIERIVGDRDRKTLSLDRVEHPINRWMMERTRTLVHRVNGRLESYYFGDAAELVRQSFWGELCDFYLEAIKVEPLNELEETAAVLYDSIVTYLKLFHPFLPFITEVLWGELVGEGLLIRAPWPNPKGTADDREVAESIDTVMRLVTAVRAIRNEQGLEPGAKVEVAVQVKEHRQALEASHAIIARLVRAEPLVLQAESVAGDDASIAVDAAFEAAVRLSAADRAAEKQRFEKQLEEARQRLAGLDRQLSNENFVNRAKPEAVAKVRDTAAKQRATVEALEEQLAKMG